MMNPQEKRQENNKRNISFLGFSVLLHVLLLLFFTYRSHLNKKDYALAKESQPSVQFLEFSDADKMPSKALVEQDEKEKPSDHKPKDAKFMSRVDKDVEKETKSVNHGEFKNENTKAAPAAQPKAEVAKDQQEKHEEKSPEQLAEKPKEMKTFEGGDMAPTAKRLDKISKAKSFKDLRSNAMNEMSQQAFAQVSQTNDYIKDVAIGAETHLKTREFLYYNYFNRIKQKLRQQWEPLIHQRVRDMVRKGRSLASDTTTTTRLVITLDENGGLARVQVATSSGLQDLDSAAMDALKVAAPFPNPPKDLITDGYVLINWDFILES